MEDIFKEKMPSRGWRGTMERVSPQGIRFEECIEQKEEN